MTIITNAGKKLITHAIINKLDLFISKVVYADCNLDTLDESTASLTNIKYENLPTSVRIDEFDNSKIILEAVLKNDTAGDFFINCVGFIAKNGELLCFTKINRTFVQSAVNNTNASLFHYKLAMELTNANDLSIKIDETIVYPTLAHFNASQKAQDEKIKELEINKADKSSLDDYYLNLKGEELNGRLIKAEKYCNNLSTNKANKVEVFTRDEINVKLNTKADKAALNNYYTKTESNNLLNAKVNTNTYTTEQNAQNTRLTNLEKSRALKDDLDNFNMLYNKQSKFLFKNLLFNSKFLLNDVGVKAYQYINNDGNLFYSFDLDEYQNKLSNNIEYERFKPIAFAKNWVSLVNVDNENKEFIKENISLTKAYDNVQINFKANDYTNIPHIIYLTQIRVDDFSFLLKELLSFRIDIKTNIKINFNIILGLKDTKENIWAAGLKNPYYLAEKNIKIEPNSLYQAIEIDNLELLKQANYTNQITNIFSIGIGISFRENLTKNEYVSLRFPRLSIAKNSSEQIPYELEKLINKSETSFITNTYFTDTLAETNMQEADKLLTSVIYKNTYEENLFLYEYGNSSRFFISKDAKTWICIGNADKNRSDGWFNIFLIVPKGWFYKSERSNYYIKVLGV